MKHIQCLTVEKPSSAQLEQITLIIGIINAIFGLITNLPGVLDSLQDIRGQFKPDSGA